ncbi:MAG: vWA domain-containing protein [Bacillota bacterium]
MKKGMTEMVFVIDRSGSMSGLESDTIGGFNSTIKKQKEEEGEATVTTVLFDNRYEVLHDRFDIKQIGEMTENEYYTRGTTALLDALGRSIKKTINVQRNLPEDERAENVIFVVITDGYENASREFSYSDIKRLIETEQEKYGWDFLFLGANIDVAAESERLGIRRDRAVRYMHDDVGTGMAYRSISRAVSSKRINKDIDESWCEEVKADYAARGEDDDIFR